MAQLHPLITAAEKYVGIVFTNINGNVLSDQFTDDTVEESNTESGIFNNQQPMETVPIKEEVEDNTKYMTNDDTLMPLENDDAEDQTENHTPDNTEKMEAIQKKK